MVENDASKVYEASPWAVDKRVVEVVRPAPVQASDSVPPKSLARDMAFAKLHSEMRPEQQAVTLSAGGPSHWPCTNHRQNWHGHGVTCATPDAGPPSCALRKGSDGDMCEQSLATHPFHLFCCKYGGPRARHRAVKHTLRRLVEQAGGCADMERHVPELYDWESNKNEAAPKMRCAILDVVSWSPGVLQQLWIDVSVRCPHAERYNESASKPGVAAVAGEAENTKRCGTAVRSLVFETCGRLGGEGTKLLRDLVATAAANGQCSPHAVGRWRTQLERVLLTAQADTYLRALGCRVAERRAVEPLLLLAE